MLEQKKESILGRVWTKEELSGKLANPDLAMGLGLVLMIGGIIDNRISAVCGSIMFGCGIIARAIRDK